MGTNEMTMVAQRLSRPNTRRDVKAATCNASWASTRQTRVFFLMLTKSLGQERPNTEGLDYESLSMVDEPSAFCKEIIFKCDGELTEENYKKMLVR